MAKSVFSKNPVIGFIQSLVVISIFAIILSLYRIVVTGSEQYSFLAWNLFLAWLPAAFAWALYRRTKTGLVWSWPNFGWFAMWLLFLPNAFYLITDFIHLEPTQDVSVMFDVVLFGTYALAGLMLGYTSLFMVHVRAVQRFGDRAKWLIAGALLLSGFAIYLGRYLRWNSWDIILNPFGLLFDVSDSIVNPSEHVLTFTTTILFFAFLSVTYFVIWRAAGLLATVGKK